MQNYFIFYSIICIPTEKYHFVYISELFCSNACLENGKNEEL